MIFIHSKLLEMMPARRAKLRVFDAALAVVALSTAGCSANTTAVQTAQDTAPVAAAAAAPVITQTPLDTYIARPEPAFKWERAEDQGGAQPVADGAKGDAGHYDLKLISQEWQGKPWTHRVEIVQPGKMEHPDTALIYVTFGKGSAAETLFAQLSANALGATFINLFNVPNQPLYGKYEDDLIAHTFANYLETGDATWPLLFPMTKTVVKAMDAIEEFSKRDLKRPITKFVIAGASKRGWTTWLTGAVDKRVVGIIPMVYNNLNLQKQMPHQIETWGEYSDQIKDYTRRGLQQKMMTPRGQELAAMVDPWSYRERITMPKLLINATNDPYWTLDSLNLYAADLKGPTSVLYSPNVGHDLGGGLEGWQRAFGTSAAWFRRIAVGQAAPTVEIKADEAGAGRRFSLSTNAQPALVRLWVARSETKDFRGVHWNAVPMTKQGDVYVATVPAGEAGTPHSAAFGEIEVEGKPLPLRLSSAMTVWDSK